MPELPEIHGMAAVINAHAIGRVFLSCKKSSMTKLPPVKVPKGTFTISAQSRGKELMMTLQPSPESGNGVQLENDRNHADSKLSSFILCNMGMTGFFEAVPHAAQKHRHAHLSFQATDGSILSFVDVRRFGSWRQVSSPEWPSDRGPDPVKEHDAFRCTVKNAISANPMKFKKLPICQVMHDQSLFNGIGNYLRAEILFRAGIAPFAPAESVLKSLKEVAETDDPVDLLTLCRDVPNEVIALKINKYQGGNQNLKDVSSDRGSASMAEAGEEYSAWTQWLRVYGRDDASWAVDKDGRRIWFRGPPGKLCRQFSQKGSLQGKGRFTGDVETKKRLAPSVKKKPAGVSLPSGKKTTKKQVLKRPAAAAKHK